MGSSVVLRTRVYVDGYNLYYGCLKGSVDKWLDLGSLFNQILPTVLFEQDGAPVRFDARSPFIKYFTAPILKNFAKADDSVRCQALYHSALSGHLGTDIQIVEGYYASQKAWLHSVQKGKLPRDSNSTKVWKVEEKQSDVAIALHAYSDAIRGEVDQVVIVSNDTDLVPALEMIRQHTDTKIGLIVPTRDTTRRVNAALRENAHWVRSHIVSDELASAQLPAVVFRSGKPVHKPVSWYPRPDLLAPIFDEAKRVKKSAGAAWKWLHQPASHLGGRVPVEMAVTDDGASELRDYMAKYADRFGPSR